MDQKTADSIRSDLKLKAAHASIERICIRRFSAASGERVVVGLDDHIVFNFEGQPELVTWNDLVTYCNALANRGVATDIYHRNPTISFQVEPIKISDFLGWWKGPLPFEAKTAEDLAGLERERPRGQTVTATPPFPPAPISKSSKDRRLAGKFPGKVEIMEGIVAALWFQAGSQKTLTRTLGKELGFSSHEKFVSEANAHGADLAELITQILRVLAQKQVVRKAKKNQKLWELTYEARAGIRSGTIIFQELIPSGALKGVAKFAETARQTEPRGPSSPELTEALRLLAKVPTDELVKRWKAAFVTLHNPDEEADHENALFVIDMITEEWKRRKEYFSWPSTTARRGSGPITMTETPDRGMLSFLQYHVGITRGEPEDVRRAILTRVFEQSLPPVSGKDYMAEWGLNGSALRLRKMAYSIASFARTVKGRKTGNFAASIREWEADLEFLRVTFYGPRLGFEWPSTIAANINPGKAKPATTRRFR